MKLSRSVTEPILDGLSGVILWGMFLGGVTLYCKYVEEIHIPLWGMIIPAAFIAIAQAFACYAPTCDDCDEERL